MSTPRFVFLSETDLPPGAALPWAIHLRSGELLAPAGFLIQDEVMQQRLLATKPVRAVAADETLRAVPVPIEEHVEKKIVAPPPDPLRYLKHNAEGVVLTFKLPGDDKPRVAHVEFYGRMPRHSVIVSAPPLGGAMGWQNFEGLPMSAQVVFGKSLCVFKTTVMRYAALPHPHLFLHYPSEAVAKSFRQTLRVDARLATMLTLADGYKLPALITNLSGSGCALETGFELGQNGASLVMTFKVQIAEKEQTLSITGIIRSIRGKLTEQIRYGIEFDESVDDAVLLTLRSYVYEHLAER